MVKKMAQKHNKQLQKKLHKEARKLAQAEIEARKEVSPEEASYRSLALIASTVELLQAAPFAIGAHQRVATSLDFLEAMHNNLLTDCRKSKLFMDKYPDLAEKPVQEKAETD